MTMYCETREPHACACECDHCIADRRFAQLLQLSDDQNKALRAIWEALEAIVIMMKER